MDCVYFPFFHSICRVKGAFGKLKKLRKNSSAGRYEIELFVREENVIPQMY